MIFFLSIKETLPMITLHQKCNKIRWTIT